MKHEQKRLLILEFSILTDEVALETMGPLSYFRKKLVVKNAWLKFLKQQQKSKHISADNAIFDRGYLSTK